MSTTNTPVLVGQSEAIRALRDDIALAARTSANVLILGETGAGSADVARSIHSLSSRSSRAFIAVTCRGIPDTLLESRLFGHSRGSFIGAFRDKTGLVQQADAGTLFLDDVDTLSLRMQALLSEFIETGVVPLVGTKDSYGIPVDVRLITTSTRDLGTQMSTGAFHKGLFYRLNVIQLHVPPLRDRGGDILLLLEHHVDQAAQRHGLPRPMLTPDAAQFLLAHDWPGNISELRSLTDGLVLQRPSRPVTVDDLILMIRRPRRGRHYASGTARGVRDTHCGVDRRPGGDSCRTDGRHGESWRARSSTAHTSRSRTVDSWSTVLINECGAGVIARGGTGLPSL